MMIGAPDMAFARLNTGRSGWLPFACYAARPVFFRAGRRAGSGLDDCTVRSPCDGHGPWTSHDLCRPPARTWSSILGAINIITTILNLRAPGMTLLSDALFVWTWLITAYLLLAVDAGVARRGHHDAHDGTSAPLSFNAAGGGDPVLYHTSSGSWPPLRCTSRRAAGFA